MSKKLTRKTTKKSKTSKNKSLKFGWWARKNKSQKLIYTVGLLFFSLIGTYYISNALATQLLSIVNDPTKFTLSGSATNVVDSTAGKKNVTVTELSGVSKIETEFSVNPPVDTAYTACVFVKGTNANIIEKVNVQIGDNLLPGGQREIDIISDATFTKQCMMGTVSYITPNELNTLQTVPVAVSSVSGTVRVSSIQIEWEYDEVQQQEYGAWEIYLPQNIVSQGGILSGAEVVTLQDGKNSKVLEQKGTGGFTSTIVRLDHDNSQLDLENGATYEVCANMEISTPNGNVGITPPMMQGSVVLTNYDATDGYVEKCQHFIYSAEGSTNSNTVNTQSILVQSFNYLDTNSGEYDIKLKYVKMRKVTSLESIKSITNSYGGGYIKGLPYNSHDNPAIISDIDSKAYVYDSLIAQNGVRQEGYSTYPSVDLRRFVGSFKNSYFNTCVEAKNTTDGTANITLHGVTQVKTHVISSTNFTTVCTDKVKYTGNYSGGWALLPGEYNSETFIEHNSGVPVQLNKYSVNRYDNL